THPSPARCRPKLRSTSRSMPPLRFQLLSCLCPFEFVVAKNVLRLSAPSLGQFILCRGACRVAVACLRVGPWSHERVLPPTRISRSSSPASGKKQTPPNPRAPMRRQRFLSPRFTSFRFFADRHQDSASVMPCVDPRCGRISAAREFPARRGGTDKTANDHSA